MESVSDVLIEEHPAAPSGMPYGPPTVDMSGCVVGVPSARVGRRLLEILAVRSQNPSRPFALIPPEVVAVERLSHILPDSGRRRASRTEALLAWVAAMQRVPDAVVRDALPVPPDFKLNGRVIVLDAPHREVPTDISGKDLLKAAESMGEVHSMLTRHKVTAHDAARTVERLAPGPSARRWQAIAILDDAFSAQLESAGLKDPDAPAGAVADAAALTRTQTVSSVMIVHSPEISPCVCSDLAGANLSVTHLVWAPPDLSSAFDMCGRPIAEAWEARTVPVTTDMILAADYPRDQAALATEIIAELSDRFGPDDFTLCLGDPAMEPIVREMLAGAHVATHGAFGRPLDQSRPLRLLTAAAAFLEARDAASFAALIRHPDLDPIVGASLPGGTAAAMAILDRYRMERLATRLPSGTRTSRDEWAPLQHAVRALERTFAGIGSQARPLTAWIEPIAAALARVYEPVLGAGLDDGAELRDTIERVGGLLRETATASPVLADALRVSGPEALRIVSHLARRVSEPETARRDAIEIVDWFELAYDDARVKIICGMNEGFIPEPAQADGLLPEALRRELGLPDSRSRYARDCLHLSALAATSPHLRMIVGRQSVQGDAMRPSRLLFACDGATLMQRAELLFSSANSRSNLPLPYVHGHTSRFALPRPQPPDDPVNRLPVTAFRDYLRCPYRFYLRHILRLQSTADDLLEMDAALFGSLLHDALGDFGRGPASCSTDARDVRDALDAALAAAVARRFGDELTPALALQVENARGRLRSFAQWQADRARNGWCIVQDGCEVSAEGDLNVDGTPFRVYGRIDRIERHEETGEYAILDYKSGDTVLNPERTHRRTRDGITVWTDLQLPLYRAIAPVPRDASVTLGYLGLGKDPSAKPLMAARWTPDDLADAMQCAEQTVRNIRQGVFWPPNPEVPPSNDGIGAICFDGCADRFVLQTRTLSQGSPQAAEDNGSSGTAPLPDVWHPL